MIAMIDFRGLKAILNDSGIWESKNKFFAELLNVRFGTKAYPPTPAAGTTPYNFQVRAAQAAWKVKVKWAKMNPGKPEDIH